MRNDAYCAAARLSRGIYMPEEIAGLGLVAETLGKLVSPRADSAAAFLLPRQHAGD